MERCGLRIDFEKLKKSIPNQTELADFMGITRSSLHKKLSGSSKIVLDELNQIAQYLDRDTDYFLEKVPLEGFENKKFKRPGRQRKQENAEGEAA